MPRTASRAPAPIHPPRRLFGHAGGGGHAAPWRRQTGERDTVAAATGKENP